MVLPILFFMDAFFLLDSISILPANGYLCSRRNSEPVRERSMRGQRSMSQAMRILTRTFQKFNYSRRN